MTDPLGAPHHVTFSYDRSVGGAERTFLTGLAQGQIWGSRGPGGSVTVPPVEWDPGTGSPSDGYVQVADAGEVRCWTWVSAPGPDHPLERPFAFALVQLDGATTCLLHVVDVPAEEDMVTGLRVVADWRPERVGSIRDVRAFVPAATRAGPGRAGAEAPIEEEQPREVRSELDLTYTYEPGRTLSGFLRGLGDHRIEGGRCPSCSGVYVPPHPRCPACRTGPLEPVEVGDRGAITSFTVVHLPFRGMTVELPFVSAWIRLDGADVAFAHLVREVDPGDVAIGQPVQAVWVPDAELAPTWESISHFRPVGEGRP